MLFQPVRPPIKHGTRGVSSQRLAESLSLCTVPGTSHVLQIVEHIKPTFNQDPSFIQKRWERASETGSKDKALATKCEYLSSNPDSTMKGKYQILRVVLTLTTMCTHALSHTHTNNNNDNNIFKAKR